jgi:hypothetical protein
MKTDMIPAWDTSIQNENAGGIFILNFDTFRRESRQMECEFLSPKFSLLWCEVTGLHAGFFKLTAVKTEVLLSKASVKGGISRRLPAGAEA